MKEKVILITGAAHRIGAHIAKTFHANGAKIVIHFRHSRSEAEALAQNLNSLRDNSAVAIQANLSDTQSYPKLIQACLDHFGRLDGLVNNASEFFPTPLGTIDENCWETLMASNLKAPFFLSQAAIPHLRASKGMIINIVDVHAEKPMKTHSVYCIAKAGLAMMTKALAKDLGPDIRVNGISPGAIAWPDDLSDARKQDIIQRTALKRAGSPEDIANTALFMMRDAHYMTGQIIAIDGGRSLNL